MRALLASAILLGSLGSVAGDPVPFGIVYGPKAVFNIAAPERVAYVQLPKAVAYIVYTSDDPAAFLKHQAALVQLLNSFTYLEPKHE